MIYHRLLVAKHMIGYFIRKKKNPITYIRQVCEIKSKTNFTPAEIVGYELAGEPEEKLRSFLPANEYIAMSCKINEAAKRQKVTDKTVALNQLGKMIRREWLDLRESGAEDFVRFYQKHKELFLKKYNSSHGLNIYHYKGEKSEKALRRIYEAAMKKECYLAEQPIRQHEAISEFCPYCINPIRIHTVNNKKEIKIRYMSSISFGGKNSPVSNLGHGGTALIENGYISTDLFLKKDPFLKVKKHCKGSKKQVKGSKIPYYEEAESLVKQAAALFQALPYLAFDIAITPDGPEIIEINAISGFLETGQKITNHLTGIGNRMEIMNMFDEITNQMPGE